jgi:hypothetical protein
MHTMYTLYQYTLPMRSPLQVQQMPLYYHMRLQHATIVYIVYVHGLHVELQCMHNHNVVSSLITAKLTLKIFTHILTNTMHRSRQL